MTIQPFLTMLTKNAEGRYDYAPVTTTFLAELIKLLISISLYLRPSSKRSHRILRTRDVLNFAIPAFVYFVNNNLIFVILMYVNSTTYQILSSLKTVATGILFRVILKRQLDDVQSVSILVLACGAATSQFPTCATCDAQLAEYRAAQGPAILSASMLNATWNASACETAAAKAAAAVAAQTDGQSGVAIGVACALAACLLSAFAGVYSELLLKKDGDLHSIHLQNMLLYAWGVVFNSVALVIKDHEQLQARGLFGGYTFAVWLLVTNNALNGLTISAILKFANNIVRVFAHTAAMILTMALEVAFMGAPLSPQFCVSITIVSCSTYLYNSKPPPKAIVRTRGMHRLEEEADGGGKLAPAPTRVAAEMEVEADAHSNGDSRQRQDVDQRA